MPSICDCKQQVAYALKKANIRTSIFARMICQKHEFSTVGKYVECVLVSDPVVTKSAYFRDRQVSYHCTTVSNVSSILHHGELLMNWDINNLGDYLPGTGNMCMQTHPDMKAAVKVVTPYRSVSARWDDDQTKIDHIVLRLRQLPNSFDVLSTTPDGRHFETWRTRRRGTIYIDALLVFVSRSKALATPETPIGIGPTPFFTTFSCPLAEEAFDFLRRLDIDKHLFNGKYNRCYCCDCYPAAYPDASSVAGEMYIIPRGWVRFGLAVNPVFAEMNDIWRTWNNAYHGCSPLAVQSIVEHRTLGIAGDRLRNGKTLGGRTNWYFLSPSIEYAAHDWYSKPLKYASDGWEKEGKTVICFKVRTTNGRRSLSWP